MVGNQVASYAIGSKHKYLKWYFMKSQNIMFWFEKDVFISGVCFMKYVSLWKSHGLTNVITKETKSHSSTKQIYILMDHYVDNGTWSNKLIVTECKEHKSLNCSDKGIDVFSQAT